MSEFNHHSFKKMWFICVAKKRKEKGSAWFPRLSNHFHAFFSTNDVTFNSVIVLTLSVLSDVQKRLIEQCVLLTQLLRWLTEVR